jgi:hypothetical protein
VGRPGTHAKLIVHQAAVKGAVETLRAKTSQLMYIFGKYKFLVDAQILNWTNKACFRNELPLGSLGSNKLATSESSFTGIVTFQLMKFTGANLLHAVTVITCSLLNFMQASLNKSEVSTGRLI